MSFADQASQIISLGHDGRSIIIRPSTTPGQGVEFQTQTWCRIFNPRRRGLVENCITSHDRTPIRKLSDNWEMEELRKALLEISTLSEAEIDKAHQKLICHNLTLTRRYELGRQESVNFQIAQASFISTILPGPESWIRLLRDWPRWYRLEGFCCSEIILIYARAMSDYYQMVWEHFDSYKTHNTPLVLPFRLLTWTQLSQMLTQEDLIKWYPGLAQEIPKQPAQAAIQEQPTQAAIPEQPTQVANYLQSLKNAAESIRNVFWTGGPNSQSDHDQDCRRSIITPDLVLLCWLGHFEQHLSINDMGILQEVSTPSSSVYWEHISAQDLFDGLGDALNVSGLFPRYFCPTSGYSLKSREWTINRVGEYFAQQNASSL